LLAFFSLLAGSRLQEALMRYVVPRQSFEWIADLILGIAFLLATALVAFRLVHRLGLEPSNQK